MYYQERENSVIYKDKLNVRRDIYIFIKTFLENGWYGTLSKAYFKRGTIQPSRNELKIFKGIIKSKITRLYYEHNSKDTIPPYYLQSVKIRRSRKNHIVVDLRMCNTSDSCKVFGTFYLVFDNESDRYQLRDDKDQIQRLEKHIMEIKSVIDSYDDVSKEILSKKEKSNLEKYPKLILENIIVPSEFKEQARLCEE